MKVIIKSLCYNMGSSIMEKYRQCKCIWLRNSRDLRNKRSQKRKSVWWNNCIVEKRRQSLWTFQQWIPRRQMYTDTWNYTHITYKLCSFRWYKVYHNNNFWTPFRPLSGQPFWITVASAEIRDLLDAQAISTVTLYINSWYTTCMS